MGSLSTAFVTHELKGALKFNGRKFDPPPHGRDRHYQLKLQQLFRVSHFNPAGIARHSFFI
jgi:hypothetical protein